MLRLTRRSEYGLMALALLARRDGSGYCSVREIVAELGIPRRLLAEILKDLAHAGIAAAMRGPGGGYRLCRPASELTLARIVSILEGPRFLSECDGGGACEMEPGCGIRAGIRSVAQRIHVLLEGVTLEEIAAAAPRELKREVR